MGICVCCGKWRAGSELAGAWVCCECQKDIENYSEEMEIKSERANTVLAVALTTK